MSLNKFTDISTKKEWMNINCNEVDCNDLKAVTTNISSATAGSIAIVRSGGTPVYLEMEDTSQAVDNKKYGFYSTPIGERYFARFSDAGPAIGNFLCFSPGEVRVPGPSLSLVGSGGLVGVPAISGSFYNVYDSVGNNWSGIGPTINTEYRVNKVGSIATLNIKTGTVVASSPGSLLASATLPTDFRPYVTVEGLIQTEDNSVFGTGNISIDTSGQIRVYARLGGLGFAGAGTSGFINGSITYDL